MALVLSGSVNISGSMTATTIVVSAVGAAGMVSSSNQLVELNTTTGSLIGITNGLMAVTASMKAASIVSSSQQITNYYKFAETASANTFYGTQTISGSLLVSGSSHTIQNGYVILQQVSQSLNFVDDAAAAAGGVPLGGLYRNGNFIVIRIV